VRRSRSALAGGPTVSIVSARGESLNELEPDAVRPSVAWLARSVVQQDDAIAEAVRVDERER
jgi:hypothetical protein